MAHWTDTLFKEQAPAFAPFFDRRFDEATEEVQLLLDLLDDEFEVDPGQVLDVACGTGRHVIAFADEGCRAQGIDFSETFITRARERTVQRGLDDRATFCVHDMRVLDDVDGRFDLVTCFWNSLGYYDRATDVEILAGMRRSLTDDGVVVIEMGNKEFYVRNFEEASVQEEDDRLLLDRRRFDVETARFETTVDVFTTTDAGYEHLETMAFAPRLYAPVELRELCECAGFEDVAMFGGFEREALTLESSTVVVVAG